MVELPFFIMQRWTGNHLRAWRKALGMTQEDAADTMRVSLQAVRQWEQGEVPVPHWAGRFAALYWARLKIEERLEEERKLIEDEGGRGMCADRSPNSSL